MLLMRVSRAVSICILPEVARTNTLMPGVLMRFCAPVYWSKNQSPFTIYSVAGNSSANKKGSKHIFSIGLHGVHYRPFPGFRVDVDKEKKVMDR